MKAVRIGCSGWAYKDWRGAFYPQKLPQREWLAHYASTFETVEINSTFYRLPSAVAVGNWIEQTPRDSASPSRPAATSPTPAVMGIAPAFAMPKALARAGLAPADIDVWEVHEAYAAQALAVLHELPRLLDGFEVPDERLNPNGGAVAIGHPFGSSGTRYVLTLATELRLRKARYGVLGVCVGSGQGVALVLENPQAA